MDTNYRLITTVQGVREYIGDAVIVAFDFETAPDDPMSMGRPSFGFWKSFSPIPKFERSPTISLLRARWRTTWES